jgi:hypothetical protein
MIYLFEHPTTGEIREVYQKMNDPHVYNGEDGEEEISWNRIFTIPTTCSNTQSLDPYSYDDFKKLTTDKQMTVGDMQDLSAQMSEKRAEKDGVDSFKEKHYDKYSKMRKGTKHMNDTRPNIKTEFKGRTTPKLPQ